MKPALLLCLLLTSCSTFNKPIPYSKEMPNSLTIQSDVQIKPEESLQIQEQVDWARSKGLTGHVTVRLSELDSWTIGTGQKVAGQVFNHDPIMIIIPRSKLSNLSHELFHVILHQQTGYGDPEHKDPRWKGWGLF